MNKLQQRILLIEDEEDIRDLIHFHVEKAGFAIQSIADGYTAMAAIKLACPSLILLDLMLPGKNGSDLCCEIKAHPVYKSIPIIMLTAKSSEADVVAGFELGASDYITKPFSPNILISRIRSCLRQNKESDVATQQLVRFGSFALDLGRYVVYKGLEEITLTLSEFNILKKLLLSHGQIFSRDQLLNDLGQESDFIIDRNIDVHIHSIRKKLGPNFRSIETVRSLGYRFRD